MNPCSRISFVHGICAPSSNSQKKRMKVLLYMAQKSSQYSQSTLGRGNHNEGIPHLRNAGSRPVCPTANRLGSLAQQRGGEAVTLENTEKATGRQPGETGARAAVWTRHTHLSRWMR